MAAHTITPSPRSPSVVLMYAAGGIPLSRSSPHSFMSVEGVHTKPRFVREEDTSPLNLSPVLDFWCILAQLRRFCCLSGVRSVTIAGERALRLTWWSLRRTVLALIRGWRIPAIQPGWSLCGSLCSSTESVAEIFQTW